MTNSITRAVAFTVVALALAGCSNSDRDNDARADVTAPADTGSTCDEVFDGLSQAYRNAGKCDPALKTPQCTRLLAGPCCRGSWGNPANGDAIAAFGAFVAQWKKSCHWCPGDGACVSLSETPTVCGSDGYCAHDEPFDPPADGDAGSSD